MGNSTSQTVKNYVTNSTEYNQIMKQALTNTNTADVSTYNLQNMTVEIGSGAELDCENVDFSQKITENVTVVQNLDSKAAETLANSLQAAADNDIETAADQLQELDPGWFGEIGNSSKQEAITKVKNAVKNTVSSENVMTITNEILTKTINEQNKTFTINGKISGKMCNFSQDIVGNVLVQNILSSVSERVSENETISDFFNKSKITASQEQEGTVGSVMDVLKEFKWVFIIAGIVLGLMLVIFIFYKLSSGGSQQGFPYQFPPMMPPQPQAQPVYQQPRPTSTQNYAQAQQYSQPNVM